MQCPNCGHENTQTTRFCARCGFDVNAPEASSDPAPAPGAPDLPSNGTPYVPPPPSDTPANPWGPPSGAPTSWGPPPAAAPPQGPPPPGSAPPLPPYAAPNPYAPPAPQNPYGQQPGAYSLPGYPAPYGYQPGYGPPPATNGLAIASLILGLVGWVFCIGSVIAIVLGVIARGQIRTSQGRQTGDGLALAGIILGAAAVGLFLLFVLIGIATGDSSST